MRDRNLDQVILVDEHDKQLGVLDKVEAHRGQGKLHRAISVFLFNDEGKLLIQRRSAQKIVAAGQWANTACGNVRPGESYLTCALRRLEEELGIKGVELQEIGKFQYQVEFKNGFSENEIDTVFVGIFSGEVQPNPAEASAVDWIEFTDLLKNGRDYAPWVGEIIKQSEITKVLTHYANI